MINLMQGDCLELMKNIPDNSVDMILCDLPYGTTHCEWDIAIDLDALWAEYNRILKPNGAAVLFGSEPFSTKLRMSNLKNFRYDWIWEKPRGSGFIRCNIAPLKTREIISIFGKHMPAYYPQMMPGKYYGKKAPVGYVPDYLNNGGHIHMRSKNDGRFRYPKSILHFNCETGAHPTQKPVALLEYLIKTYSLPGDVVLDNCMGSGSTGVACVNTGRDFIGIELDNKFFDIAAMRISEAEGQLKL